MFVLLEALWASWWLLPLSCDCSSHDLNPVSLSFFVQCLLCCKTPSLSPHWSLYKMGNNLQMVFLKCIFVNSLAPGRCINNLESVIFKHMSRIKFMSKIALRSVPQNITNEKSTLVQVMGWCRQVPSHYLSRSWPRSLSPYGITRPQWVN